MNNSIHDQIDYPSERSRARRQEKVNSLLRRLTASFLTKQSAGGAVITITRIETSKDLKSSKIFISIFPENKEKEILTSLKGKVGELRKFIGSQIKMRFLPRFEFAIDEGEKARQRIDKILGAVAK